MLFIPRKQRTQIRPADLERLREMFVYARHVSGHPADGAGDGVMVCVF
jgi:hypothetical protein